MIFFYHEIGFYGPEIYSREIVSGIDEEGKVIFEYFCSEKPDCLIEEGKKKSNYRDTMNR